jgi:hypothetical protein
MAGVFKLLERIGMKFPKGRAGLNAKILHTEKVNYALKRVN